MILSEYQGQSNCITPNGLNGRCIGIRQCSPLLSILQQRPLQPEVVDFLRQSQCGFNTADPRVCCAIESGNSGNPTQGTQTNSVQQNTNNKINDANGLSNNPLLSTECGKELSQRITGGERTELDEFPWMALLEYVKRKHLKRKYDGGTRLNIYITVL